MPARYYTYKAGPVQFIAIDTEGWSDAQLEWIKQTLAASASDPDVKWRIVYGHHPIYTSGVHLNERRIGELRLKLLPVLKAAHVDLYICGHDHDLEHLRSDGMEFLICGGGGAKLRGFWHKDPLSVFTDSTHAFLDLTLTITKSRRSSFDVNLNSLENPRDDGHQMSSAHVGSFSMTGSRVASWLRQPSEQGQKRRYQAEAVVRPIDHEPCRNLRARGHENRVRGDSQERAVVAARIESADVEIPMVRGENQQIGIGELPPSLRQSGATPANPVGRRLEIARGSDSGCQRWNISCSPIIPFE